MGLYRCLIGCMNANQPEKFRDARHQHSRPNNHIDHRDRPDLRLRLWNFSGRSNRMTKNIEFLAAFGHLTINLVVLSLGACAIAVFTIVLMHLLDKPKDWI